MRWRLLARIVSVVLVGTAVLAGIGEAQSVGSRWIVSVVDERGAPVTGLASGDVTVTIDAEPVTVSSFGPAPPGVQVAILFEGLAASPQLVSEAITTFSTELGPESGLDVFTVSDDLPAAIDEAVDDLRRRVAPRPVIVLLGQANRLSQSRRGLTIATGIAGDVEGDIGPLADRLVDSGTIFYGVSVTNVALDGLVGLADASGGRFEIIASADQIVETLTGIARELAGQYVLTAAAPARDVPPAVAVDRPGTTVRVSQMPSARP